MKLNVESVSPLWFAYFPRHVAEHYLVPGDSCDHSLASLLRLAVVDLLSAAKRLAMKWSQKPLKGFQKISRRQYLSRMDRFQHGRSGANFRT
ncbi:hypothetical protein [Pseudomonas nitroreducens]|uniref:Uncharacterized protein n=1 Tax=Pseudomonas nitroreducens TaxID=46680 RepID=A0A246F4J5_PSENT|nr:hypothetical protein [Pseudomonas nitroreducens]OWP48127.1 hypothetical protein CEG18_24795 [Pseudomonas nitroreducens]